MRTVFLTLALIGAVAAASVPSSDETMNVRRETRGASEGVRAWDSLTLEDRQNILMYDFGDVYDEMGRLKNHVKKLEAELARLKNVEMYRHATDIGELSNQLYEIRAVTLPLVKKIDLILPQIEIHNPPQNFVTPTRHTPRRLSRKDFKHFMCYMFPRFCHLPGDVPSPNDGVDEKEVLKGVSSPVAPYGAGDAVKREIDGNSTEVLY